MLPNLEQERPVDQQAAEHPVTDVWDWRRELLTKLQARFPEQLQDMEVHRAAYDLIGTAVSPETLFLRKAVSPNADTKPITFPAADPGIEETFFVVIPDEKSPDGVLMDPHLTRKAFDEVFERIPILELLRAFRLATSPEDIKLCRIALLARGYNPPLSYVKTVTGPLPKSR